MKSVSLRLVIKTAHEGYTEQDTPTHSSTYTDAHINHEADTYMIKNNGYDLTATRQSLGGELYITYSLTPRGRSHDKLHPSITSVCLCSLGLSIDISS